MQEFNKYICIGENSKEGFNDLSQRNRRILEYNLTLKSTILLLIWCKWQRCTVGWPGNESE
jgi:hypothetical protein